MSLPGKGAAVRRICASGGDISGQKKVSQKEGGVS